MSAWLEVLERLRLLVERLDAMVDGLGGREPVERRALVRLLPAAASLGVPLVVYGYFAYTFKRYTNAAGKINGSGLIAPTF